MRTAVYCVSKNGYETCLKIRNNVYKNLHIYVSQRVANMLNLESENVENLFVINERVPILLEKTFDKYDLHIFVAATGAVVRIIEGKFKSKDTDPAVITVDDHANFVISLLSGHLGGANEECKKIANGIGAIPVITTASDVGGKIAVDTLSQKIKAKLESLDDAKRVTSLIVNGENVSIHLPKNIVENDKNCAGAIIFSNRKNIEISKIIPKNIILGIGCKRNTSKEKIIEKINYVMETQNLEMDSIKKAASAWVKSDEIGLLEAMTELNIPIEFFEKEKILEVEDLVEECSEFVKNQIGVYGVSEPCAYLASSRKGSFLVKKVKLEGITISIFEEEMQDQRIEIDFEKKIKLKDLKEKEKIVRILIFGKREEDEEISEGVFLRKGTDSKDNKFYVYDDENEDKILTVFAGQNENLDFFKFVNKILGENYKNIEAKYGGRY